MLDLQTHLEQTVHGSQVNFPNTFPMIVFFHVFSISRVTARVIRVINKLFFLFFLLVIYNIHLHSMAF